MSRNAEAWKFKRAVSLQNEETYQAKYLLNVEFLEGLLEETWNNTICPFHFIWGNE